MNAATPNDNEETKAVGATTKTKPNDREASARTLPDESYCEATPRSVMSHAQSPNGLGAHSQRGFAQRDAGGGASGVGAAAPAAGAVPAAACEASRRAQLAGVAQTSVSMRNAIEAVFANEVAPHTMEGVIEAAQTLLNAVDAAREARKDTEPKPSSLEDYERKQLLVDEAMEEVQGSYGDRLVRVMGGWAGKAQTFRAMRSALRHRAVSAVRSSLRVLTSLQGKPDFLGLRPAVVKQLQQELPTLGHAYLLDRDVCLAAVGCKSEPASSKSRMLKRLPMGWREGFLEAVASSAQYAMPCALLDACGLRPVELEKGVAMEMKGDRIQVRIEGGKVRDGAGQPWRQFELTREALPAWAYDKVNQATALTVSADPDALRAFIGRVSEKLFPRHDPPRANDILLSAYLFRHALVSDLRAEGWDSADIAAVIGESSAQTTKWYGVNWGTGGRRSHKTRVASIVKDTVQTARPVRPASTAGLDMLKEASNRSRSGVSLRR
ncbi:site-specific integrase [Kinneretia aquatilis]|nr:site-specific integrase [Paucibacter aquatile]